VSIPISPKSHAGMMQCYQAGDSRVGIHVAARLCVSCSESVAYPKADFLTVRESFAPIPSGFASTSAGGLFLQLAVLPALSQTDSSTNIDPGGRSQFSATASIQESLDGMEVMVS
jgi:hypothetical protein